MSTRHKTYVQRDLLERVALTTLLEYLVERIQTEIRSGVDNWSVVKLCAE